MSDFLTKLEEAMDFANCHIYGNVNIFDLKFQRFRNKHKPYKGKDLFVKIIGNCQGASFGDWHYPEEWVTWWYKAWSKMSPFERQQQKNAFEIYKQNLLQERHLAMERAREFWNEAKEADPEHPYIKKKRIIPYGARQLDERLFIPVYPLDPKPQLQAIQIIHPNGFKHVLDGTSYKYGTLILGQPDAEKIYLCEGWATGCTLYEVLGERVIITFSARNLGEIAGQLRLKIPNKEIIICADNDYKDEPNAGLESGKEAARISGSRLTFPTFDHLPQWKFEEIPDPSDFNDLICLSGWEEVENQVLKTQRFV